MNEETIKSLEEKFPIGVIVSGKVIYKAHYGVLLDIGDAIIKGFVLLTELPYDKSKKTVLFPELDDIVKGIVIDYIPERKEISISMKNQL